ncbi:MAG: putative membrane protein [Salinirussus sp.]|jgi:putative membrane protein
MAVANRMQSTLRARPGAVTAVLSVVGYVLVGSALNGALPLFPELSRDTVLLFSDLIAVINTLALASILAGVYFIRNREYRKHRAAMLTAFSLITLFLFFYLWKTGGGFEKSIVAPEAVTLAYLAMLGVHILLSVLSVPVVLYAVILGLTHSVEELKETRHAQVGRVAASAWAVSLFLGIVTYLLLNHVYTWEVREATALLLLVATPKLRSHSDG